MKLGATDRRRLGRGKSTFSCESTILCHDKNELAIFLDIAFIVHEAAVSETVLYRAVMINRLNMASSIE